MAATEVVQVQQAPAQQRGPWYKNGSLPLGSCIGGVSIYLHWSFFLLLAMMLLSVLISRPSDGSYWLLIVLVYGPILLLTIIIHEFGHAMTTKALGGQVGDIVLWPLGGFVICGPAETVKNDFLVALAGPMTHLPQMALWLIILSIIEGGNFSNLSRYVNHEASFGANLCSQAFYLNVVLFVFNLFVPAYPLDGGRCLGAGLVMCGLDVVKAAMATGVIGMVIAAAFVIWGIIDLIQGAPGGLFVALTGAWIFMSSFQLFKLTRPASGQNGDPIANLRNHPVFGQQCYQRHARDSATNNNTANSDNC